MPTINLLIWQKGRALLFDPGIGHRRDQLRMVGRCQRAKTSLRDADRRPVSSGAGVSAGGFTYDHWVAPAIRISQQASSDVSRYQNRQTPVFVGLKELNVLCGDDFYMPLFEFSQRRQWPELTRSQLMKRYRLFRHSIAAASPAGEPCLWKGLSLKRRTRRRRGRV